MTNTAQTELTTESKMKIKPNTDIWEIIAKYPSGQAGQKEDEYIVSDGNVKIRLSHTDINVLFELYKPATPAKQIINQVEKFKQDQLEEYRNQTVIDNQTSPETQPTEPDKTEPEPPTKPEEPQPQAPTEEPEKPKPKKRGSKNE